MNFLKSCLFGQQNSSYFIIVNSSCKKKTMQQEPSELKLDIEEESGLKMFKGITKQFLFDPIDQMGIQVNEKNRQDEEELRKLIGEYLCYPSTELAEMHSQAMRIGNYDLQNQEDSKTKLVEGKTDEATQMSQDRKVCPCCGFVRQEESIKICIPFNEIKNIGASTHLYFSTFKSLTILLVIMGLVYSIYAIATNIQASKNSTSDLYSLDYISISLAAKQKNPTSENETFYYIQCWLGLGVCLLWILVMIGIKYKEIKTQNEYDDDTSSVSDYSIVIQGVPLDATQEEMQRQLNGYYEAVTQHQKISDKKKRPFNIKKYNVGKPFYLNQSELNDKSLAEVQQQIKQMQDKFIQWILERRERSTFSVPKEERQKIYQKYEKTMTRKGQLMTDEVKKIQEQLKNQKGGQLTTAFITFDTNLARNLMAELNEVTIYSRFKGILGDKNKFVLSRGDKVFKLDIEIAPEPEDIIWTNIGLDDCSIYSRKLFTYTFTLMLLGGSFGIVYGLSKEQNRLTSGGNATDDTSRYLSIAISLVIAITNVIIGQAIKFLTLFERDYTNTYNQASLAVKSIFAQMINSILIPVVVAYYIKENIYATSGLVDNIFMMSFSTALVGPFVVLFDPVNLLQKVKKCWKSRIKSKLNQTQREHNSVYEGIEFEVGYEYIYIGNLFMFVCFYVSLQPICVFVALLGYFIMYWAQKYCMLYRYRRPVPGSDFVNQTVWQIIHLGPLLYSLGALTWSNFMPGGIPERAIIPNLIALGFSVLLIVVPIKSILIAIFFDDEAAKLTLYDQMRITFSTQYDRLNPSTQEEGMKEYHQFSEKYVENFKKLSAEKQAQIAKKKQNNNQRGQMNQFNQASHQAPDIAGIFGGAQGGASLFSNLMQQPASVNPYQVMPGVFQNHGSTIPPMNQPGPGPRQVQPQPPPNPFGQMFGGPAPMTAPVPVGPRPMMGPPMYPGMPGMQGPGYQPPMNQMFQIGMNNRMPGQQNPFMMNGMNGRGFGW